MISVRPYKPNECRRWNQFVQTARNPHFIFEREYMDYHANRFADESLMFESGKGLVAVLPAHQRTDPTTGDRILCSHDGLTFAGLITAGTMRQATMQMVFEALREYLHRHRIRRLRYRAMPSVYSLHPNEEDLWCLHRLGARLTEVKVAAVLRIGGLSSASQTFRRQVRLAAKAGIEVDGWDDVESFHDLLSKWLHERYGGVPVHSAAELRLLCGRFPAGIRILAAKHRGKILAANLIFQTPTCTRLQYAANTSAGLALGAAQSLIAHLMETQHSGRWLDLGASMDTDTGELHATLHSFKEACGARSLLQNTYELTLA